MRQIFFILLLVFFAGTAKSEIKTPYPEVIELKQINSAEKERIRLCQIHKKFDKQPTGFYIEKGRQIVIEVDIKTPADGGVMPSITVGTMGFNVDGRNTGISTKLEVGRNVITNHEGGLIWLSFLQHAAGEPKGTAEITFTSESQHVRAPRFVRGVTGNNEFREMVDLYTTPDVLFQTDYAIAVATREAAIKFNCPTGVNNVTWLKSLDTLLELEDEISGLDDKDPNPVHHRLKAGEVRHLLVENTFTSPHANPGGFTAYCSDYRNRYLTELGTAKNSAWAVAHEVGHQHQQAAYLVNQAGESTVNIYSYIVERYFQKIQGNDAYNRTSAKTWAAAKTTYLQLPFSKRIYNMDDALLFSIIGFNRDELRFMPWEQMLLIFGDDFYKTLHRVVREEKETGGSEQERRSYLIWKASQVCGYDLTEFFNIWGIRVTDPEIKANLRAKMADAKSKSAILDLSAIGLTAQNLASVTGQALPEWAPIALRGITAGDPVAKELLGRTGWSVATSHEGPYDKAVGGNKPEYIIDNDLETGAPNKITSFVFVKPGGSYEGITVPKNDKIWFTIDMGAEKEFNFIEYTHRSDGLTYEQLRARKISVYGSNDGSAFTPLKEGYQVDYAANANQFTVDFPAASYRYIKVTIDDWNTAAGSTIQVADFQVGKKREENYPAPAPLKFNVTVAADNGIVTSQAGANKEDEDSEFMLSFSLAPNRDLEFVKVDGDEVKPVQNGSGYSLAIKVQNHLAIQIASKAGSGIKINPEDTEAVVYPNPVKAGQPFSISFDGNTAGAKAGIYNLSGIKLFESEITGAPLHIGRPGVYILKVKKDAQVLQTKIIVE